MKTFRWTVPDPPLSSAERRSHNASRAKRNGEEPKGDENDLKVIAQNWRERWALHALRQQRSIWSPVWIIFYAGFITFIHNENTEYKGIVWFLWIFAVLMIDQSIRAAAIHSILKRQEANKSEMATPNLPSD